MDEETLLDTAPPTPSIFNSLDTLTAEEKAFIVQAVSQAVELKGTFTQLTAAMNLIESICNKLTPRQ